MLKSCIFEELEVRSKGLLVKKMILLIDGPHSKEVIVRKTVFPETR
jgi:hypothetical protein